ncbi:hypothetical protein FIU87_21090 [Bacillus sp. THAF10]|uniref:hypothetical protein n=1 Tax=Bacillus sp. THAF10 TaxID=2587848 RepID=UPI001267FED3|nr:hypothetical protein [Bacillus sp. THAF10]QFT91150.1 hypothetical protein FIU87_21090 [Bacillus sp. THAF10]
MNEQSHKLLRASKWAYALLYIPLFGYKINQELYLFWVFILVVGGVAVAVKNGLIRTDLRVKITLLDTVITAALVLLIFSNIGIPVFIKQVIFFVVVISVFYTYTKALYAGKLT